MSTFIPADRSSGYLRTEVLRHCDDVARTDKTLYDLSNHPDLERLIAVPRAHRLIPLSEPKSQNGCHKFIWKNIKEGDVSPPSALRYEQHDQAHRTWSAEILLRSDLKQKVAGP
jgi:hypothetical protein